LDTAPFEVYSKFFISLLAIIDPPAAIPIFLALTVNRSEAERRRDAGVVSLALVIILLVSLYVGELILRFFGISFGSFRIAGGVLLMLMALELMKEKPLAVDTSPSPNRLRRSSDAVVPLAMPLLAGPGAISAVILYGLRDKSLGHYVALTGCILLHGLVVWIFLRMASQWRARISDTAITISNKIMSLIMVAVAVEFIANGIKQLFGLT
jgi:multiple antibiotic resistance protein